MVRGQGRITENELHFSLTHELDKIDILNGTVKANKIDLDEHKKEIATKDKVGHIKLSGITKEQVGLGNVQNYGIATKAEAEAGTNNSKYMTPLRVKEAISKIDIISSSFSGVLSALTTSGYKDLKIPLGKIPTKFIKITGMSSGGIKSIGHGYINIETGVVFLRELYPYSNDNNWYEQKMDTVLNGSGGSMYMLDSSGSTTCAILDKIFLEGDNLILRYHWRNTHDYNKSVVINNLLMEVL